MTQPPMLETVTQSKIHLIGGEKGGVGKSMVARLLAQYFIDHAMPFVGYDTDRSHGALLPDSAPSTRNSGRSSCDSRETFSGSSSTTSRVAWGTGSRRAAVRETTATAAWAGAT